MKGATVLQVPPRRVPYLARPAPGRLLLATGLSVIGAVLLTALLVWSGLLERGQQEYDDVIAGELALGDYDKSFDYRLGLSYLISFALMLPLLAVLVHRHGPLLVRQPRANGAGLGRALPFLAIAAGSVSVAQIVSGTGRVPLVGTVSALVFATLTTLHLLAREAADVGARFTAAVLAAGSALLSLLGVLATLTLVGASPRPQLELANAAGVTWVIIALAAALLPLLPLRSLRRLAVLAQVPAPLVFVTSVLRLVDGPAGPARLPLEPQLVLAALALIGGLLAWQCCWAVRAGTAAGIGSLSAVIGPATVLSVAAAVAVRPLVISSDALGDDFHVGENLIQWQQVVGFGSAPYDDFFPVPGLIGALVGGLNAALFEGTLATYPSAAKFLATLAAVGIAALATSIAGRTVGLAVALLSSLATSDRVYVPLLVLLLLAQPRLQSPRQLWLAVWATTCYASVLLMPSTGASVTLATLPLAAWRAYAWLRELRSRQPAAAARQVAVLVMPAVVGLLVLFPLTLDIVEYLRLSQGSNVLAYGIGVAQVPFAYDFGGLVPGGLGRWLLEPLRFSGWLVALPLLACLAILHLLDSRDPVALQSPRRTAAATTLLVGAALFLLVSIPYAWGRVDPASLSRPGILSLPVLVIVTPLAGLLMQSRLVLRLSSGLLALGFPLAALTSQFDPVAVVQQSLRPASVPPGWVSVSGREIGLERLGETWIDPLRLQELRDLDASLDARLRSGETFFDLTNRAALYAALDRPVPTVYSGEYYAADEATQSLMLRAFAADPPPVVLADTPGAYQPLLPDPAPIGMKSGLRSYRIARWLVERGYRPEYAGTSTLLVRPDRATTDRPRQEDLALLEQVFRPDTLGAVPEAWGKSWETLRHRFGPATPAEPVEVTGPSAGDSMSWTVPSGEQPRPDFGLLDLDCPGTPDLTPFRISWGGTTPGALDFLGRDGRLLLPLGSSPAWLARADEPVQLTLTGGGPSCLSGRASLELRRLRR